MPGYVAKPVHVVVPETYADRVYPGGGVIRPTVVVDGLAAGTWTIDRSRKPAVVRVEPFEALETTVETEIEVETSDIDRFLDTARISIASSTRTTRGGTQCGIALPPIITHRPKPGYGTPTVVMVDIDTILIIISRSLLVVIASSTGILVVATPNLTAPPTR